LACLGVSCRNGWSGRRSVMVMVLVACVRVVACMVCVVAMLVLGMVGTAATSLLMLRLRFGSARLLGQVLRIVHRGLSSQSGRQAAA